MNSSISKQRRWAITHINDHLVAYVLLFIGSMWFFIGIGK